MKLVINIKEKEKAIKFIEVYRIKKYERKDVRFINVNLLKLNELLKKPLFSKNDLFINSETLWELMQEVGDSGTHNYHGLTSEDIVMALTKIVEPYALLEVENERHAIVTTTLSHYDEPLMIIIKVGSRTHQKMDANINKIITIYPKSDIDRFLSKCDSKKILFSKNKK